MKPKDFNGIIPPLLSSFTKNQEINNNGLRELIEFSLPFINGYYPIGTYGCGPLMSVEERKRTLEMILEIVNGRVPVVAHVGHSGTQPTIELALHAKRAGASGVGAISPYYAPHLPEENLFQHFASLIDAVQDETFPVFVYNNAHYSQNSITPHLLNRLAEFGLRGCKDSSFDIVNFYNFQKAIASFPDFNLIVGTEAFFVSAFDAGSKGMICGLANVFPEMIKEMFDAYEAGKRDEVIALQRKVLMARDICKSGPTVPILHEILKMRGIDAGFSRSPMIELDETTKEKIKVGLTNLGLL